MSIVYRLSVVRVEPNPNFDAEKERERRRYAPAMYGPEDAGQPQTVETRSLDVVLTEGEYEAVKHAVLEIWK